MDNTNTPTTEATSKKKDLYTIDGVLESDIEIRSANTKTGPKPFAYGKIKGKNGKVHTIVTYVGVGIDFLTGKKAGEAARCYGTFEQQDKGRTFSVMGQAAERKVAEAAEASDAPSEAVGAELVEA